MMLNSLHDACLEVVPLVANHLWQSTLFAVVAGVLTLVFKRNHARIRFGLWLAASLKFLIPFSLFVGLGSYLAGVRGLQSSIQAPTGFYYVVEEFGQPFTRTTSASGTLAARFEAVLPFVLAAGWLCGLIVVFSVWWVRWRRVVRIAGLGMPLVQGRELNALRQLEQVAEMRKPLPILLSQHSMEPGVVGIIRPVLIWPERISEHLDEAQLRAILAHELWHVRRRDNLAATLHMLVEAVFWFHPLVWWIGARLVEERERSCDEEVLRLGNQAEVYAESILKACKFCMETPMSCVSGVAGSNLKRRIVHIMSLQSTQKLTLSRKALLAAAAALTVTGPVLFGVLHAPRLAAQPIVNDASSPSQSFDTVSVKPSLSQDRNTGIEVHPGSFSYSNTTVKTLIKFAYGVEEYQISGAPDWADTERYDVAATWHPVNPREAGASVPPPPPPPPPQGAMAVPMSQLVPGQLQAMVKTLLAERFGLKLRRESQDLPVYDLVVASTGAKLTQTPSVPPPPSFNGEPIISVRTMIKTEVGELSLSNGPVSAFAGFLSGQFGRQVVDKTGLKGNYDVTLRWTPGQDATESIVAALQDQLGLKLESQHGPVDVLVVNQVEKPTEN